VPYVRKLRGSIVWMASYYVPNELLPLSRQSKKASRTRIKEPAASAGYPNSEKAAGQLESRRRREIADGSYSYEMGAGEHTAETWLNEWTENRNTRYKAGDKRRVELHFLPFRDFRTKSLSSFRSEDFRAWARHGRQLVEQKAMESKNFWTIYGVVHKMFEDAIVASRIQFNPCKVDVANDMPRKRSKRGRKYDETEVQELVWCEALPPDVRMLMCGLAFTGERVGEFCGHVWSDWDRDAVPMTALTLQFQYNREPLKTDTDQERPRVIPVHPELGAALAWWQSEGWQAFFGRAPRPADPIFPNFFKQGHHTKKSVYHRVFDAFQKASAEGLIRATWKAHHALRHAFTTALIGRGANPVWVERITHNASGKLAEPTRRLTVNHYTHTEWQPLCDAMAFVPWKRNAAPAPGTGGAGGNGPSGQTGHTPGHTNSGEAETMLSNQSGRRDSNSGLETENSGKQREKQAFDTPGRDPQIPGNSARSEASATLVAKLLTHSEEAEFLTALGDSQGALESRVARPPTKTSPYIARKRVAREAGGQ